MSQRNRILIGIAAILFVVAGFFVYDILSHRGGSANSDLPPGAVPIIKDNVMVGAMTPEDLEDLEQVSFKDAEEGKTQEGWLLSDALSIYINTDSLSPGTPITVSSSSREKSVTIPWSDVSNPENFVMFDVSGRGTLKLVSLGLDYFDERDEWVQDADQIDIITE